MSRRTTPWCISLAALPLVANVAWADTRPAAGNPQGTCAIPEEAKPADTRTPDHVVGNGTPASCTADAFIEAVAEGRLTPDLLYTHRLPLDRISDAFSLLDQRPSGFMKANVLTGVSP